MQMKKMLAAALVVAATTVIPATRVQAACPSGIQPNFHTFMLSGWENNPAGAVVLVTNVSLVPFQVKVYSDNATPGGTEVGCVPTKYVTEQVPHCDTELTHVDSNSYSAVESWIPFAGPTQRLRVVTDSPFPASAPPTVEVIVMRWDGTTEHHIVPRDCER